MSNVSTLCPSAIRTTVARAIIGNVALECTVTSRISYDHPSSRSWLSRRVLRTLIPSWRSGPSSAGTSSDEGWLDGKSGHWWALTAPSAKVHCGHVGDTNTRPAASTKRLTPAPILRSTACYHPSSLHSGRDQSRRRVIVGFLAAGDDRCWRGYWGQEHTAQNIRNG